MFDPSHLRYVTLHKGGRGSESSVISLMTGGLGGGVKDSHDLDNHTFKHICCITNSSFYCIYFIFYTVYSNTRFKRATIKPVGVVRN